jgi:membrane dipeptidase
VSPAVMSNALDVAEAPVIFSHSGARALVDHPRNVPDSILRRLPKNGGVVMVPFVPGFVSLKQRQHSESRGHIARDMRQHYGADTAGYTRAMQNWDAANPAPRATLNDVADVIEHVKQVAGADHVGIGSDFDGVDDDLPIGLEDQSKYPALFAELIRRGWSDADLRKLAGDNVLRALGRAEQVAKRLQKERPPSTKTIQDMDRGPRM